MKKTLTILGLALCMTAPAVAQEKKAPAAKVVKSRHAVLRDAFADVAVKTHAHSVQIVNGSNTLGYGVFIEGGYVLTAAPVVKDQGQTLAIWGTDFKSKGKIVGVNRRFHIALIQVPAQKDRAGVRFGSAKELAVGQYVISVGVGKKPVAVGVVSAKDRRVTATGRRRSGNFLAELFGGGQGPNGPLRSYASIIQHDSKVRKEAYGTPVYNADGFLVGINVERAYRGSSYFVSIDSIKTFLPQLKSGKGGEAVKPRRQPTQEKPEKQPKAEPKAKDSRGFVGVTVETVQKGDKSLQGTRHSFGARIKDVHPDSGAAKAGLKSGDVIVSVDGQNFSSFEQFARLFGGRKQGDKMVLGIIRGGWGRDVTVTLGARPN